MGICGVSMIPNYGEGIDAARARLRKEIDDVLKEPKREDYSIPYSEADFVAVDHFVAREEELEKIHISLLGDGHRRTVVLHGLGGVGKTQLAMRYARRYKDSYSAIFWLNIHDHNSVQQCLSKIARRIARYHPSARGVGEVDMNSSPEYILEVVNAWLSEPGNTRWLAIYDNYDNPKLNSNRGIDTIDIRRFLPEAFQGAVIITTRSAQVSGDQVLPVKKFTVPRESLEILSSMSKRDFSIDDPDVSNLLENLDGLPLALATTGAYLNQTTISVAEYLALYQTSWNELHQSDPGLDSYDDRTLYSTWRISLERVRQRNELAVRLLGLWCYFNNRDLWFELLCAARNKGPPWIQELTANLHVFTEAMRVLCNHALVEAEAPSNDSVESQGYRIHNCVHTWSVHVLNSHWDLELARFALDATAEHVPGIETANIFREQRLLHHAKRCLQHFDNGLVERTDIAWSLFRLCCMYVWETEPAEEEAMYQRALRECEKELGPEHDLTLILVCHLGHLYVDRDLAKAEVMFLRAVSGFEKSPGPCETLLSQAIGALGKVYEKQGRTMEAAIAFQRAMRGLEKTLGPEHIATLFMSQKLGLVYKKQGRPAEAEAMFYHALHRHGNARGPEHRLTLMVIDCLGDLCLKQGRLSDAEAMFRRVSRSYHETLGPEPKLTLEAATRLHDLADVRAEHQLHSSSAVSPGPFDG